MGYTFVGQTVFFKVKQLPLGVLLTMSLFYFQTDIVSSEHSSEHSSLIGPTLSVDELGGWPVGS